MTTQQLVAVPATPVPATAEMSLAELMQAGAILAKSGFFPDAKSEAQAVAKVLAGAELGIGPVASLRGIDVIEGKLALSAGLVAALIKRSGRYDYRVVEQSDTRCELAFLERGRPLGSVSFSLDDAKRAGLISKQPWQRYPGDLLFARAITRGGRRFCADLFIGGVYTPEELRSGDGADVLPFGAEGAPAAVRADADDLYGVPSDVSLGEPYAHDPLAESVAALDEEDAQRRHFWARAKELGYTTPEGRLSKRRVHEALGIAPRDGALAEAIAAGDYTWELALVMLEDNAPGRADDVLAPDVLGLPAERAPLGSLPDADSPMPAWDAALGRPHADVRNDTRGRAER
jgi:hypothetical protein